MNYNASRSQTKQYSVIFLDLFSSNWNLVKLDFCFGHGMAPPMPRQVVIKPITISKIGSADDYYYYYYHPDYNYYSDQQYDNYYFEYPSNDYYSDYSKLYSNSASNNFVDRKGVSGPFHSNAKSKAKWLQKSGYPNLKRNGVAQSGQSGSS